MGSRLQVLWLIFGFLIPGVYPECSKYVSVSGMANSIENICRTTQSETVSLKVQVLHNGTAGSCDKSEWNVTNKEWNWYFLWKRDNFTIKNQYPERTFDGDGSVQGGVLHQSKVYGVVVDGKVDDGTHLNLMGYIVVGCPDGQTNVCLYLRQFLNMTTKVFQNLPDCAGTNYTVEYNGTSVPTATPTTTPTATPTTTPTAAPTTTATDVSTTTTEPISHNISIRCISNCKSLANPKEEMELLLNCVACDSAIVSYNWTTAGCGGNNITSCTQESVSHPEYIESALFVYREEDMQALDRQYAVTVHAHFHDESVSTASYMWTFSPIPVAGSCEASPQSGYALITSFNITCQNFSVSEGLHLLYRFKTELPGRSKSGVKIYNGVKANVVNVKLEAGQEQFNYTVYVKVKAYVESGAAADLVTTAVQVFPPNLSPESSQVWDAINSLIKVGNETGASQVNDLLEAGNGEDAVHLMGIISSTINTDGDSNKTKEEKQHRTELRTALVESLGQVNVSSFEMVTDLADVLNDATEEKDELTTIAQTKAANLYESLADTLSVHQGSNTMSDVTETSGALLYGVTKILDIQTDTGRTHMNMSKTEQQQHLGDVEEVKNVSTKLLNAVDKVSSTLMSRKVVGQNASVLQTDTMTVTVERLTKKSLSGKTYNDAGSVEKSQVNLKMPASLPDSMGNGDIGVQLLQLKKNPYVWDASSRDVNTPVMSIDLKDSNNAAVAVTNLSEPIRMSFTNNEEAKLSNTSLYVHLVKTNGILTLNSNHSNTMTFNFTSEHANFLAALQVVPQVNNTLFKMYVSTEQKPNLSEIIDLGFLYPVKNITQDTFASFKLKKSSPNSTNTVFFTTKNDSVNYNVVYFVGMAVDPKDPEMLASLQVLDPVCVGNTSAASCSTEVEIPLQIATTNLGCSYWLKNLQRWSSDGCEASPMSTRETVECLCTHMTAFSGGVFVRPNFVDPLGDAALFLTFFDNPVVVTTVILIWIIYFFLIHWTRQADFQDRERVGVISCPDNDPAHEYVYLVCVATGWWKDAGTTANIYFCMQGTKGDSPKRCLSLSARRCFQVGYEDWFLLTAAQSLGDLQTVTVWHDNSGPSPHWYITQVYIKDLQSKQGWTFIVNDWLAADRGSTMTTSKTIPALTEADLKYQRRHNFMLKTSKDLRDGHLWISIFSKPVQSPFTRPQRLTCALSLLLCTMLTNIMFYGIPTDDPEDQVAGIEISLSTIVIGIESSLLMFPINILILQLFLWIKPRPHKSAEERKLAKEKSRIQNYLKQITKEDESADDFFGTILGMASTSVRRLDSKKEVWSEAEIQESCQSFATSLRSARSNLIAELEEDLIEDNKPNRGKFLPWWFVYIAWTVVMTVCVVASYFVMLYGLKYGYMRSVAWLVSFLTGFTQSAFITQPIKVVAIAMVFTLVFKKTVPFEDLGPDRALDDDEQYLQRVADKPETHIPHTQPLSSRLIMQIKDRLKMEWLMNAAIRDLLLYFVYLTVVMLMVHGHRNIRQVYLNTRALENMLVNPSLADLRQHDHRYMSTIIQEESVDRFYQYLDIYALPRLADMTIGDHDYATPGSNHFLMGPFRLRQLRVANERCDMSDNWILEKYGITTPKCTNSYWIGNEDDVNYSHTWAEPMAETPANLTPWSYQSAWALKTMPLPGKLATYSGGGYVWQMPVNPGLHAGQLKDMYNSDWIDARTRAVLIEFTVYNPNVDLFSVVVIKFEFSTIGSVMLGHQIFTTKLYHNTSDLGTAVLVSECLFLLFNLVFAYIEYRKYKKLGRKEYFEDFWSYTEILQLGLSFSVVGLFFQRMISVNTILEEYRMTESSKFVSFYTALFWDMTLGYVMAFLVCLVTLKFIKLLRFNKRTFMVGDALSHSRKYILSFLFMVAVFFMAFAHFGLLVFGRALMDYKNMYSSLMSVFNFALGLSDLPGLQGTNRILGPVFFVIYVMLAQFCFLTIFMAVLNIGIIEANDMYKKRKSKFDLIGYIVSRAKLVTGTK